jgi:hypothetical protein
MEAVITTKSHIKHDNEYHFFINKYVTPCELYIWTTEPLTDSFYISYKIKKDIYGDVQPLIKITNYEEHNIYYDKFNLYKSKTILCFNEELYNTIFYKYDSSCMTSLCVDSSIPCNINNMYLISYINTSNENLTKL